MFQNLQVKGTSVSWRTWQRPTPAPVWDIPLILTVQRSQIHLPEMLSYLRSIWMTSRFAYPQGPEQLLTTAGTQRPVPEWVTAHILTGRAVETRSLPLFPVSTLWIPTELRPQATCAAPSAAVCFWCVSTCCLLKGTWVPYFLVRHPWSPGYVSSTMLSTEVIKTELGTVLAPKLITSDLAHHRLLQKDLLN